MTLLINLKKLFILKASVQSYKTRSPQVFHIPNAKTPIFGINTLTYDGLKICSQFHFLMKSEKM